MACRIEADPHVILRLESGEGSAEGGRLRDRTVESSTLISRCTIICGSPGRAAQTGRT
jgi:hypothetical protein